MKECPESRRPLTLLALTTVTVLAALLAVIILSFQLPGERVRIVGVAASTGIAAVFLASGVVKFRRQHRLLRAMCSLCDSRIVYATRRFTYSCRTRDGDILCYSSASNRVYLVRVEEVLGEEEASPWEPLDFYCVKPVKGNYEKGEGKVTFKGEYLFYDSIRRKLVRARGAVESLNERWLLNAPHGE
ncbi:MAG: hypothetical protein F7C35_01640 [Desulfurococcales archaeon]|nr:hypothetical protein [Desulfurococcales archaeon]